jgi:hypothetical protein
MVRKTLCVNKLLIEIRLQEQKILLQKLLAELEPTNQIKVELEQAKKVILQLLEDSSKTTQEVNTAKKKRRTPNHKSWL